MFEILAAHFDQARPAEARKRAMATAAAMIGAVTMSRVLTDQKLSDSLLQAVEERTHRRTRWTKNVGFYDRTSRRLPRSFVGTSNQIDETLVVDGIDVGVETGYSAAQTLLDRKVRPTAMIVLNNSMVVGALNAIKEKGLMIPQDIAVIGWNEF